MGVARETIDSDVPRDPNRSISAVRFLADSTLSQTSVEEIRALGNDIEAVDSDATDRPAMLERAVREDRLLMSFDASWHDLVFEEGPRPRGVVCFDFEADTPHDPVRVLAMVLGADELELDGAFTLLGKESMRQKAME